MSFFSLNPAFSPSHLRHLHRLLYPPASVSFLRLLSLDVGQKHVGISMSDPTNRFATHRKTFHQSTQLFASHLSSLLSSSSFPSSEVFFVPFILVGFPLLTNGKRGEQCQQTLNFLSSLRSQLTLNYPSKLPSLVRSSFDSSFSPSEFPHFPHFLLWDERFSSSDVRQQFDSNKLIQKMKDKGRIDSMVAANFLTDFIEFLNKQGSKMSQY